MGSLAIIAFFFIISVKGGKLMCDIRLGGIPLDGDYHDWTIGWFQADKLPNDNGESANGEAWETTPRVWTGAAIMVFWIGVTNGVTMEPVLWTTLEDCEETAVGTCDTTVPTLATEGTE